MDRRPLEGVLYPVEQLGEQSRLKAHDDPNPGARNNTHQGRAGTAENGNNGPIPNSNGRQQIAVTAATTTGTKLRGRHSNSSNSTASRMGRQGFVAPAMREAALLDDGSDSLDTPLAMLVILGLTTATLQTAAMAQEPLHYVNARFGFSADIPSGFPRMSRLRMVDYSMPASRGPRRRTPRDRPAPWSRSPGQELPACCPCARRGQIDGLTG
jgi:hypothetical protein